MRVAAKFPRLHNYLVSAPHTSRWIKRLAGFAEKRSIPQLHRTTLRAWHATRGLRTRGSGWNSADQKSGRTPATCVHGRPAVSRSVRWVHLFCDEFTDFHDTHVGIAAIELLERLGYQVVIPRHTESGRAHLSKGLVRMAQKFATKNVELLKDVVTDEAPLIGLEPSALLGFRDEYPDLVPAELKPAARELAKHALLFDEFVAREATRGHICNDSFRQQKRVVRVHGHCHQKALSSLNATVQILELAGLDVRLIPSGCCGMAGSFGYEAEHFEVSQLIGELVLFPTVRATPGDALICAPGTSCRHQIKDGTGRVALHPR